MVGLAGFQLVFGLAQGEVALVVAQHQIRQGRGATGQITSGKQAVGANQADEHEADVQQGAGTRHGGSPFFIVLLPC